MMQLTNLLLLRRLKNRPTLPPPIMVMALRRKQYRIVTISTPSDCASVVPSVCPHGTASLHEKEFREISHWDSLY
jgi:hypothetical protein